MSKTKQTEKTKQKVSTRTKNSTPKQTKVVEKKNLSAPSNEIVLEKKKVTKPKKETIVEKFSQSVDNLKEAPCNTEKKRVAKSKKDAVVQKISHAIDTPKEAAINTATKTNSITTNKTYTLSDPCPCGSGKTLGTCCGRYFDGKESPSTPEELLRSRYTAHVTHHHEYLINTTHSEYKSQESEADIAKWIDQLEWKGLTILTATGGKQKDSTASIFFIAQFSVNGIPREMKETAHFIKENGKWFYTYGDVEGHITYKRETPKIGRNDPCSCGSGKKYKKCCLV